MLRLELAQYREIVSFTQFGADLDQTTKRQLHRGERLVEILKQGQYQPMNISMQVLQIFAATGGFVDDYPVEKLTSYLEELGDFFQSKYPKILSEIEDKKIIGEELKGKINSALTELKGVL
jgi:F-type H+-transporting ATPase subunit alpha